MESNSNERSKAAKKNIRKTREYAKEQKEQLLDKGGWSVLPNAVFKEVIPRIISDAYDKAYAGAKRKPNIQDIAFLYSILLSYANTDENNDYLGASWVSTENLAQLMRISRNRIAALSNILEANGLIKTVDFYEQIKRRKLYFVIHITNVSEDGYVVNAEGEKIEPSIDVYRALTQQKNEN
ncbi:hypothetical protein [Metabacillus bambusae]|uniref:Helix-turn-helix domain-containing protein n=1 Tax=Metabacillus bambusae TaxID=2795218 RepID=A0ABS3N6N5_9BACI|nr:hypothetical protein [Metabacillus bambusae]MBO1513699.1 hypothetical protein [Metabacillus bambusae]